jgi:hypothetical protein
MKLESLFRSFLILATLLVLVPTGSVAAVALPQVNGLFFGDGDYATYYFLADDPGRGSLYYYPAGDTLYLAVVVDTSVNDNVFGYSKKGDPDRAYVESVSWVQEHSAKSLIKSDNVELTLQCGASSWTWMQGYIYDADGDVNPREADWLSGVGDDSSGGGNPPPGLVSASSLMWNLNNAAALPAGTWDVTLGGTRIGYDNWKSVDGDGDNNATDEGWPTYSAAYQWEWPLVYEMSIDVTACGSDPVLLQVVSAHNSPAKDGVNDIPIYTLDYSDAPDSYGTDKTNSGGEGVGASHRLLPGGPILGNIVDADPDGSPDGCACTDDDWDMGLMPHDDEDGVVFTSSLIPGQPATVQVSGTAGAKLDAWIDFDGNGIFDAGEQIATSFILSGGADVITFNVPAGAVSNTYARFRVSSAGGLSPTGLAPDGEVEDYVLTFTPTAVTLVAFEAAAGKKAIILSWETVSEVDNLGFNLYRAESPEGPWLPLNRSLIPSLVPPGSPFGTAYRFKDFKVAPGTTYYYKLESIDVYGRGTMYGPASAELPLAEPISPVDRSAGESSP